MSETITADETLDTSGMVCPLPVYKAALVLNRLAPGGVLYLIATDPGALEDIPALARQRGDELLGVDREAGRQLFWIRKGGGS